MFSAQEGKIDVPAVDILSFSFDKQHCYEEDKPILLDAEDSSNSLTARTFTKLVRTLIAGFRAFGLREGDCVLCQIPNTYFYPAIYFAIIGAGGVWCGSNPANQVTEVDHFVELANPRFTITSTQCLPTFLGIYEERQLSKDDIFVLDIDTFPTYLDKLFASSYDDDETSNEPISSPKKLTDLLNHGEQNWRVITDKDKLRTTPAAYYSTSGTTGLPKLAMITHRNLVAHHHIVHQEVPFTMTRLITLPLFHLFATSYTFVQPIRYGHQTYVMKRFQLEGFLRNIDRYQITETYMAPPILYGMLQSPLDVRNLIKTLRYAGCGGAPIDAVSINKMRALMSPDATLSSIWGMTEIGVATSFRYGENDESGSIGRLMRGMEGKLVDSNGEVTEKDGDLGELYIRTDGIMLGYRNIPLPDDEKEWLRTGDVCRIREGKLYVVGRAKELIKVKGWQVAPAELESVLLQHPEIIDAAVVGTVAKDGFSEVPRAYIIRRKQLHESNMVTADEIYKFSRVRLASYKALDGGVCFVEEIPRTPSGKIQRSKLLRMNEYRRSVTAVLMASTSTTAPEDQQKVAEIKDTALEDAKMVDHPTDPTTCPRRSKRISSSLSRSSMSSGDESSSVHSKKMRIGRKAASISGSSEEVSPTRSPIQSGRISKKKTRRKDRKSKEADKFDCSTQAMAA